MKKESKKQSILFYYLIFVFCEIRNKLKNCKLTRVNLSSVEIYESVDFLDCDLTGANLQGLDLGRTTFSGSILSEANLANVKTRSSCFNGANLSGANLQGADLYSAEFNGANLTNAKYSYGAFSKANLSGVIGYKE